MKLLAALTPARARMLTLLGVLAVAAAALTPGVGAPGSDKLQHLLAFAALVFPTALAEPRRLLVVLPLVLVFGAAIEVIQPVFDRRAEFADFAADALGAGLGAAAGLGLRAAILRLA